jgi:hypothetical protein
LIEARNQPDPQSAVAYLIACDNRVSAIKFIPDHMRYIEFVWRYMNEYGDKPEPKALPPKRRSRKR